MKLRTKIILIVIGVAVLMAAIHFTVNGIGSLRSLNPHG